MRRETKIGLLAIITLIVGFFGYRFLKGQGVFSGRSTYYIVYENVDQLGVGDLVVINGFRVGSVTNITLNPDNVRSLVVAISVDSELPIPDNAAALIKSDGLLGGHFISLEFDEACNGENCAESGDYLLAAEESLISSLIGDPAELSPYIDLVKDNAGPIIDSITSRTDTNTIGRTIRNLESTTANLSRVTEKIDLLLAQTSRDLNRTANSVASITENLARNNEKINSILANVDSTTSAIAEVDLQKTLTEVNTSLEQLRSTLRAADGSIQNLNSLTGKIDSGQGTLGALINDRELYNQLDRTTTNLDLLLQDFRLNPKRYVNVSVFGKKQKEYELPEEDPAKPVLND